VDAVDVTVWGLVERAAREHPDRVLFGDEHGRLLTARDFRDGAERVAAGLALQPGQVVSWQLPSVLEAVVLFAALARVGAVQNPLITALRYREMSHIIKQVGASLLIVPDVWRGFDHGAMARALGPEAITLDLSPEVIGDDLRLPMGDPSTLPPPPTDAKGVRYLYFSSGTTAEPKGAMHTDASVIAASFGITDQLGVAEDDVYPIAWPYPHVGGVALTVAVLRRGGQLVLFDTFDPATIGARMATHRPTILGSATPFFRAYLAAQHSHGRRPLYPALRAVTAGGAPVQSGMVGELLTTFGLRGVHGSWGLTEFPVAASISDDDSADKMLTTVGRPAPGVRVRVVDRELRLKGPQCFVGYVDAQLDAAAFDEDGWFRTGDLGEVDAEGYITISGRLKEVILRNAENISAVEVEDVLLRHPDIGDAAVFGLPDPRTGESVCAVVVTNSGAPMTVDAVVKHCAADGLARYKTPERIETVHSIPRNAMGKVLKHELRSLVLAPTALPPTSLQ
jgi:cyclohexanecarboxylate-CoA ligase